MNLEIVGMVDGLPDEEQLTLQNLVNIWSAKLTRNELKQNYYDGHNRLKDLGISIPPPLKDVQTVVGWPAKAVDALAVRSYFEGFVFEGTDDFGMEQIVQDNNLKASYQQAVSSELINSCAFVTVSKGGTGEPGAIITPYSALTASAIWDYRHKRIKAGLTVVDIEKTEPDGYAEPVWLNLYTDTDVWEIVRNTRNTRWTAYRVPHRMGRPMIEVLRYRPTLDRPFGRSRINRAVMSITDSAVRAALRTEVAAEFFTAPQKYILGADDKIFESMPKWEAYMGNWLTLTKDEDGDFPRVGQMAQYGLDPHTNYFKALAARFSGETSIPLSELGIVHDNPASAEAIYAAKESLVIEAESLNETNGSALRVVGQMAIAASQGKALSDLTDEERSIKPRFRNPARPSLVSQADAISKVIAAIPWIADTNVALEEFGFSEDQIVRMASDKAKANAKQQLQTLINQQRFMNGTNQPGDGQRDDRGIGTAQRGVSGADTGATDGADVH